MIKVKSNFVLKCQNPINYVNFTLYVKPFFFHQFSFLKSKETFKNENFILERNSATFIFFLKSRAYCSIKSRQNNTSNGSFSSLHGPLLSATPPVCILSNFIKNYLCINSCLQGPSKLFARKLF